MYTIGRITHVIDHKLFYRLTLTDGTVVLAHRRLFGLGILKPRPLTVGCTFGADIDADGWIIKIHKIERPGVNNARVY